MPANSVSTLLWRLGDRGNIFFMNAFQRVCFLVLEKALGCKSGKRLSKKIYISKGQRNNLQLQVFFKAHALRKGKGETPVVRTSGIYKGKDEKELRGLEAERSQAEVSKTVLASRNASDFSVLTLYRATYQIHYQF